MAVTQKSQTAKLLVKVCTGSNEKGNPVYKQCAVANLNPALTNDDAFDIGEGLGSLQMHDVEEIGRQQYAVLIKES